jgi:hypothetical protein
VTGPAPNASTITAREPVLATIQRALALAVALNALTELDQVRAVIRAGLHSPTDLGVLADRLGDLLDRRAPTVVQETLGP